MAAIIGSETTPTIAAVFIPEHWMSEVQLASRKEQVLAATMDSRYDAEMREAALLSHPFALLKGARPGVAEVSSPE